MNSTKFDKRFFESTRGKIVAMLRESNRTVNEIAKELSLTDNAVRAHLLTLERDGLITHGPTVKGFRKPHASYVLTGEARQLFPKHYDSLLNKLLSVLKKSLSPLLFVKALRDVGRDIGTENAADQTDSLDARLEQSLAALESLGGLAKVVRENDEISIRSEGCPFAETVAEHPEVCKVTESMIEEIVGAGVREKCDRSSVPKCRFQIDAA